jgi:hypothetical protein
MSIFMVWYDTTETKSLLIKADTCADAYRYAAGEFKESGDAIKLYQYSDKQAETCRIDVDLTKEEDDLPIILEMIRAYRERGYTYLKYPGNKNLLRLEEYGFKCYVDTDFEPNIIISWGHLLTREEALVVYGNRDSSCPHSLSGVLAQIRNLSNFGNLHYDYYYPAGVDIDKIKATLTALGYWVVPIQNGARNPLLAINWSTK